MAVNFRATTDRIGISSGRCNREVVGTVVGGVVGGIIGHNVIHTRDKNLATVAGALIGAVVGHQIGRNMDNADVNCTNQVLERAPDGKVVRWKNPNNGYQYSIKPYKSYRRADGHYCRDYIAVVQGDKTHKYREVACRTDKGVWKQQ
ncbi:MAG: RT0821/Lpp0805 family surface protein [Gammaproteobacteria bacterium]